MEVGGWVQVSLGKYKKLENRPKLENLVYRVYSVCTRVASHLACSDTPSITCIVVRLYCSDPPPHYYDAPPTSGNAPRVSLADPNCQP